MIDLRLWPCAMLFTALAALAACRPPGGSSRPDADADADADADGDGDGDGDGDVDADGDAGGDSGEGAEILPDCSACPAVGTELEHLRCAIDLCDDDVFIEQTYSSKTIQPDRVVYLGLTRAAISRFGDVSNDLAPLYPETNGSYVVMATGRAVPSSPPLDDDHNSSPGATLWSPDGPSVEDPYAPDDEYPSYDVVEWTLRLRAPEDARGFKVHYVFFSEEYDEYVGREFNDRFYMFLQASCAIG